MATVTTAPWLATFEPKREHKFILELTNVKAFFIQDVEIPKPTIGDSAKHTFLSHTFKFPGKLTWGDASFTLVDPIDLNSAALLIKHIRASGYAFPSSFVPNIPETYLKTIKKAGPADEGTNILNGLKIISLDSDGNSIEKWLLKNAFIKSVDFGGYKYEGENLKNVKVSLSVDWVDYEGLIPSPFTTAPSST